MDPLPAMPQELLRPPHPASLAEAEFLKSCTLGQGRSSGPGGQNRNKVETKVTVTHLPTGISAHAGERRTAVENRRVAVFRLRLALATRVRCAVPTGDARSALWRSRCTGGKIACNPSHKDYPAMLAEAMDTIAAAKGEARTAALRLGCTATQLIRLVQEHPPAFKVWNTLRAERGKHPLK